MQGAQKERHPSHEEITKGVNRLRKSLAKGGWAPISSWQKPSVKDPGVKGPTWVSRASYLAPPEDDLRRVLLDAIKELGNGTEQFATPQIEALHAQWTGWRKGVGKDEPEPTLSEQEKYEALCRSTTNDKVIFYSYGGALM